MTEVIHILLVDDHKMIRDGIKTMLRDNPGISIIEEADNGEEAIEKLETINEDVDVVLMDIKMPKLDGIEATKFISEKYPKIKVLTISMFDEERFIVNMLQAGAKGYILKDTGKDGLVEAIQTVFVGSNYFSKEVSSKMMNQFIPGNERKRESEDDVLTTREKEILRMITQEFTNIEIAEKLFISPRTVDTHRRNLLLKLDVKNTAGLVKYALQHGLAKLE